MAEHNSADFDWSQLDRGGLASFMWLISPRVVDRPLTVDQLHTIISRHIRKFMPVRVSKKFDVKVERGLVYTGGFYYPHFDQDNKKCIEIVYAYNPTVPTLTITPRRFWRMCMLFADTVLHEMIHMRQYRRRDHKWSAEYVSTAARKKQREDQRYLGSLDEIDAYGFNIACELVSRFDNPTAAVEYLDEQQRNRRKKFTSWRMYLQAFGHDHEHPVIVRLKKTIARYIPHAAQGRPYTNKHWLSW